MKEMVNAATTMYRAFDECWINSNIGKGGLCVVEAKTARGMPLEYEMMGGPIDEIPDGGVTWLPSQSRIRMVLPKSCLQRLAAGLAEHWSRDFRKVMRRAALQTRPRCHNRPDSLQDDRNTPPPITPSP
jgi:hypothetical protein